MPQSTFEPSIGLSYLKNCLNLTVHPVYAINTVDPADGYLSGSVFVIDFSATYRFQKVEFRGAGTVPAQTNDDKINGTTVAAVPGVRGYGNPVRGLNLGLVLDCDFGPANVRISYTKSVYGRDIAADDRYHFRLDFPLGQPRRVAGVAPASASSGSR